MGCSPCLLYIMSITIHRNRKWTLILDLTRYISPPEPFAAGIHRMHAVASREHSSCQTIGSGGPQKSAPVCAEKECVVSAEPAIKKCQTGRVTSLRALRALHWNTTATTSSCFKLQALRPVVSKLCRAPYLDWRPGNWVADSWLTDSLSPPLVCSLPAVGHRIDDPGRVRIAIGFPF